MPLVSVVMPVYNPEETWLRRAVDSVLTQALADLELILVDDGSTGAAGGLCDEYAQKDTRVTVIHQCNTGPGAARNTGIEAASGDYIGFMDADDYIFPQMYEAMYRRLIQTGTPVAKCAIVNIDEELLPAPLTPEACVEAGRRFFAQQDRRISAREFVRNLAVVNGDGSACNLLIRRDICAPLRFSNRFYEDACFSLTLAQSVSAFEMLSTPYYLWLNREGSRSNSLDFDKQLDLVVYCIKLFNSCQHFEDMADVKSSVYRTALVLAQTLTQMPAPDSPYSAEKVHHLTQFLKDNIDIIRI